MTTTEQVAGNHAAYNAACADVLGGRVLRTADLVAVDLGTGLAFLDAVVALGPLDATTVAEVAAGFYEGRPHVVLDYFGTAGLGAEPIGEATNEHSAVFRQPTAAETRLPANSGRTNPRKSLGAEPIGEATNEHSAVFRQPTAAETRLPANSGRTNPRKSLAPFGYRALDPLPVMVRGPGGAAAPPPSSLAVEVVGDGSTLAEFEQVYTRGLDLHTDGERRLWEPGVIGHPALRLHLGRLDGRPVACAVTVESKGCVGLYGVATLADDRRHGHGAAVTGAALASAPAVPAVLTASPVSIGVYRRLGFTDAGTRATWTYAFSP